MRDPASATTPARVTAQCAACHDRESRAVELGVHRGGGGVVCADCHRGHAVVAPADPIGQLGTCGKCHPEQATQHRRSLHGKAAVLGDPLAPSCVVCHEHHTILRHTDPNAPTTVVNIPFLCGRCHREGTEVSLQKEIPQHAILENFSMSAHGEALYEKGLTVSAVCTSCHTSHDILDHNHPESSINRGNVARTCMRCHARIEEVHVKVVEGEKERVQVFRGVVIRKSGGGMRESFTVRKVSYGVGVERTFPIHSPRVDRIDLLTRGRVRRAKLYYLRALKGKAARLEEEYTRK